MHCDHDDNKKRSRVQGKFRGLLPSQYENAAPLALIVLFIVCGDRKLEVLRSLRRDYSGYRSFYSPLRHRLVTDTLPKFLVSIYTSSYNRPKDKKISKAGKHLTMQTILASPSVAGGNSAYVGSKSISMVVSTTENHESQVVCKENHLTRKRVLSATMLQEVQHEIHLIKFRCC